MDVVRSDRYNRVSTKYLFNHGLLMHFYIILEHYTLSLVYSICSLPCYLTREMEKLTSKRIDVHVERRPATTWRLWQYVQAIAIVFVPKVAKLTFDMMHSGARKSL